MFQRNLTRSHSENRLHFIEPWRLWEEMSARMTSYIKKKERAGLWPVDSEIHIGQVIDRRLVLTLDADLVITATRQSSPDEP